VHWASTALGATVARVLTDDELAAVEQVFRAHGHDEPIRIAPPIGDDERIFVLPASALAKLPEAAVTADLQRALGRKVWLADESAWPGTEPLR
jgi:hypothetical protein